MADIRTGSDTTVIAVPAPLSTTGSGTEATAQRVTIATDSTGVLSVDDNGASLTVDQATAASLNATVVGTGTFAVQIDAAALTSLALIDDMIYVDDTATHATGTSKGALIMAAAVPTDTSVSANDIGALAMTTARALHVSVQEAIPAGTNNIGDVDVLSLPALVAGSANIGDVDVLTVPAPLSTTGGGTEATALRVTIANNSTGLLSVNAHAVTNAGTFATQVDGAALTALQLLDDIVYTDDTSTHATGTSKGALMMAAAVPTDTSVSANDIAAVAMTTDRKLHVAVMDALPAGTAAIGKLSANSGVDIGDVDVTSLPALPAGTNNIGDVDILTIAAGTNAIGNVGIVPRTTGGLTPFHLVSAASTNATVVKASAGQLFGWMITNHNAAERKVVFHNTASTPTAGAGVYWTLDIPGSGAANTFNSMGIAFATGIAITTVAGIADNSATAVALNDLTINLFYA